MCDGSVLVGPKLCDGSVQNNAELAHEDYISNLKKKKRLFLAIISQMRFCLLFCCVCVCAVFPKKIPIGCGLPGPPRQVENRSDFLQPDRFKKFRKILNNEYGSRDL